MKLKSVLLTASALVAAMTISAQDSEFDLSSQRGEVQEFNPVNGHKIDHKGLIINPTPQNIERPYEGVLDITNGFKINDKSKKFTNDVDFLKQSPNGVAVNITFGAKQAKKSGVKAIDGAYLLNIGKKDIQIIGYNERGAFYALQTLKQILKSPAAATGLPMLVINDYPSMKYRGVVEGFYGTPWSHKVRMSLLDFYGENKLQDYLYGPKDDPYHSSPYWRQPYPADQAKNIKELIDASKRNRVNFIWAIHPGKDIRWTKEDYDSLVNKFDMMYELGVRSFAIFFDDIEGEGTNPVKQVELLNDLTKDFVKAKGDVTNLIVCPTDYSQLWAKPGPDGPLAVYGRTLNKNVEVFWTGAVVCSDLTPETLEFINSRIKRPALYWWNFPVSDYCKHIMFQGPVYGLDTNLTKDQVAGIESNPMEHGEASKLALYGVADYAWNTPAYNPIDNWERGLARLVPNATEAYRTFAIHSTDSETGYRRDESWETTTFAFDNYTAEQFAALKNEFEKIVKVEGEMNKSCDNRELLGELAPWLTQFTKLGERGLRTLDLIKTFEAGNDSLFWAGYVGNVMSTADKKAYEAHKLGTMKLHPFYEKSMDDMLCAFYKKLTGVKPPMYKGVGTYLNLRTTQVKLMLDGDSISHYTSAYSQGDGDWIGLDLLEMRKVDEIKVRQGRNSVDDGDYFESVRLEYSKDGSTWTPLTETLNKTYDIHWTGEALDMRYVRLKRMGTDRKSWAAVREFEINPASLKRIGLDIESDESYALKAFDGDPTSTFAPVNPVKFSRKEGAKQMTLLLGEGTNTLTVSQCNNNGMVIATADVKVPYMVLPIEDNTAKIIISGKRNVHEVVQH